MVATLVSPISRRICLSKLSYLFDIINFYRESWLDTKTKLYRSQWVVYRQLPIGPGEPRRPGMQPPSFQHGRDYRDGPNKETRGRVRHADLIDLANRTRLLASAMGPSEQERMLGVADDIEFLANNGGRKTC